MPVDEVGRAAVPGAGVRLLQPAEQTLEEMLQGWRNQQLARNLAFDTIGSRERMVRRFARVSGGWPWTWAPRDVDDFLAHVRESAGARSTVRQYQMALRLFCSYVSDPEYGWDRYCEALFGTHPAQVVFEWNTAPHVQDFEGDPSRRAFTRQELQRLLDRADEEYVRLRALGRKGAWAAWRDAVALKTAYAWGLRINEVRHLQRVDFSPNPHAPQFGGYGALAVRYGKAMRSSGPKRRGVLTVFGWAAEAAAEWVEEGLPRLGRGLDLFPSERGGIVGDAPAVRLRQYRDELGLDPGLTFHSLRRSYATHLIEAGMDALFVQQQLGHEHASTTSLYTCVSSDFRVRTLNRALESAVADALGGAAPHHPGEGSP